MRYYTEKGDYCDLVENSYYYNPRNEVHRLEVLENSKGLWIYRDL